jgi:hypothetical protein
MEGLCQVKKIEHNWGEERAKKGSEQWKGGTSKRKDIFCLEERSSWWLLGGCVQWKGIESQTGR